MNSEENSEDNLSDEFISFEPNSECLEISQFVNEVVDFSDSYGSSISYSAVNICGRPSKFPAYGDFAECFSMRSYGPNNEDEFSMNDQPEISFRDYIILKFENAVLPKSIKIYETYNPGAIVRILAFSVIVRRWFILWQSLPAPVEKKSREFCPKINEIKFPTRILRIEFNHSLIDYYTGIDGVLLTGIKCDVPDRKPLTEKAILRGMIQKKLENVQFKPQKTPSEAIEDFLKNDLNRFIEDVGLSSFSKDNDKSQSQELSKPQREKIISDIPYEVMFNVMTFLDLKTLFSCAQVCKSFRHLVSDPLLYIELNLKFYWHLADSSLLKTLKPRCSLLKKLDLSSCGYFGQIQSNDFINFIRENGKSLTHLRLNSSQFMNTACLESLSISCGNLTELSIRNYGHVTAERDFVSLEMLTKLEVLDLSRTGIDNSTLLSIIKNNPNLSRLSIAFSLPTVNIDEVCVQISAFNPKMKSIDLWKCHNLTTFGIRALSDCFLLEELDVGWCLREEASVTESLKSLIVNCKNLNKLILAAIRGISERDLANIANYCTNLEHLDLMGIVGISSEMCLRILQSCTKLNTLDISFCENIDENLIMIWRNEFNACIKRSEVPNDG